MLTAVLLRLTTTCAQEAEGWLPGGGLYTDLMALLHVYLGGRLDVRLQLCVKEACCRMRKSTAGRR